MTLPEGKPSTSPQIMQSRVNAAVIADEDRDAANGYLMEGIIGRARFPAGSPYQGWRDAKGPIAQRDASGSVFDIDDPTTRRVQRRFTLDNRRSIHAREREGALERSIQAVPTDNGGRLVVLMKNHQVIEFVSATEALNEMGGQGTRPHQRGRQRTLLVWARMGFEPTRRQVQRLFRRNQPA